MPDTLLGLEAGGVSGMRVCLAGEACGPRGGVPRRSSMRLRELGMPDFGVALGKQTPFGYGF